MTTPRTGSVMFARQGRGRKEELGAAGSSGAAAAAAAHEVYIVKAVDGGAVAGLQIARLGGAYLDSGAGAQVCVERWEGW